MQNVWIIWSPLLYYNFKSLLDSSSSTFISFQCIFLWFRSTSFRVFKFLQIKLAGPNFWERPTLQNFWTIWSPLLLFNFKSFLDPNSSPCISFQSILYDSGVLLSGFSNFFKLKRGDLIFGGNQFLRMPNDLAHSSVLQFYKFDGPKFCVIH